MLAPDLYYRSVHAIDLDALRARGARVLLVDLDNTLLRRNSEVVTDEARRWVDEVRAAGFDVLIVSNNWHERVTGIAAELGVPIIGKALKPFPGAIRRALGRMGAAPSEAAIIGDQVFTDILGGRLVGMTTVLVTPLSSSDLPHTKLLRLLERLVLAGREPLA